MYTVPTLAHPRNLTRFMASKAASAWGKQLADEYPHTRYWRDRSDSFTLKELNDYAAAIIEAKRSDSDIDEALMDKLPPREFFDTWREDVRPDLIAYLEPHVSKTVIDRNLHDIHYLWSDAAADADQSSVTDLFTSYDYVELVWKIGFNEYLDDCLIYSHKPWPDANEIQITENLQFALNVMGYTVREFRDYANNQHPSYSRLPPRRPHRERIVTLQHIQETMDNACSTSFMFALYAIVPITDLIALDLSKPITFEKCWIATTDPLNGTFHDVPCTGPVTLRDGIDGELRAAGQFHYQPADICCLHTPHYHTRVTNQPDSDPAIHQA